MNRREFLFTLAGAMVGAVAVAAPLSIGRGRHVKQEHAAYRSNFRIVETWRGVALWRMLGRNHGRETWRRVLVLDRRSLYAAMHARRHCGRSIRRACGVYVEA